MKNELTKTFSTTWIVERLKERSTWLAVISLISLAGVTLQPDMKEIIITIGLAIGSLIFMVSKDKAVESK